MRNEAIAAVERYFDDGHFRDDLSRRVAIKSTAQVADLRDQLDLYLRG